MNKPIGILGGTFDPIHFGHLRVGLELYQELNLQEVRFIPCKQPVHKTKAHATTKQRLEMLTLALKGAKGLIIDKREIQRESPSYMIETLQSLRDEIGKQPLCLIIGMDAMAALNTWHEWRKLFDLAHFIVVLRPDFNKSIPEEIRAIINERTITNPQKLAEQPAGFILQHAVTYLNISASAIRTHILSNKSPRYLLPQRVLDYIYKHGIYEANK